MIAALSETRSGFETFLQKQRDKDVLRFIACGSVDDGKSTLIGRLLHDSKQLLDDQIAALKSASRRHGTTGDGLDLALLVDGLAAEREQGITIDVAYRFFSTETRTFIVADTPGHEQYTRNMATGASTADLAVLLVDAGQGLTRQTRRHALLVDMLGIRQVVLAINKMDLVGWSEEQYKAIMAEFEAFAADLSFETVVGIPLSALNGDNVVLPAIAAPWYGGLTLLQYLERAEVGRSAAALPFRMAVQWVNRPDHSFRGLSGLIASGVVRVGDRVRVLPSGRDSTVARIATFDGDLPAAQAGQSVTLVLADALDASRGDVVAAAGATPAVAEWLTARVFWTRDGPLRQGAVLALKLGAATVSATVEAIRERIDPDSGHGAPASALCANDIGTVVLTLDRPLAFDPYGSQRETASFILIDRETADTAGLGLVLPSHPEPNAERPVPKRSLFTSLFAKLKPKTPARALRGLGVFLVAAASIVAVGGAARAQSELLNVSYDPTRELYREINQVFAADWKTKTGETIAVRASHAGSGAQARAVIDGLAADVVTLALAADIDAIARATKKLPDNWQARLPFNSAPYTSTIVFLVRKGNPKAIKDWDDLAKPGIQVITPNPKTSGGARWNYLAAWGYELARSKDPAKAKDFVQAIYKNAPVLDTGARGSLITFAQRGLGDVLVAWENEAFLASEEFGKDKFDIVVPSISILAEPPVALIDGNVDRKNTRKAAEAYLEFLYTPKAQAIIAKHYYRPRQPEAAAKEDLERLPKLKLFTIDEVFGGWTKAQKEHFDDGGTFDAILKAKG